MTKQFAYDSLYEIVDEGKKQVVLVTPYGLSDFPLRTSVVNPQTSEKYEVVGIKKGEKFTYFGLGFEIIDEKNKEVALVDATSVSQEQFYIPKRVEYNSQTYTVTEIKGRISESYYTREEDKRRKNGYTDWKHEKGKYLSFGIFQEMDWRWSETSAVFSSQCRNIKEIIIPNTIKKIGFKAFYGCGAEKISIPNTVTSIGDYAFYNCYGLTSVTIPDSLTTIGRMVFSGCKMMSKVTIGRNLKEIMFGMFFACYSLKEINIPSSIKGIHEEAFSTNPFDKTTQMQLETVNIENEVGEIMIHPHAFESNAKINYIGKPKNEKAVPQTTPQKEDPQQVVSIDLEKLIAAALVDGVVTDKERAILCKKVKEAGGDVDEFEMLLDARIYEAQQKAKPAAPKAEPKKEEPKPAPKPEPKKEEPKPAPAKPASASSADGKTTVAQLAADFKAQFGSVLRIYNGRSKADDSLSLQEVGLTGNLALSFDGNQKVGDFIAQMAQVGLKVKVYTCDEWVACLDGLTLTQTGQVKKCAVKADMEKML